MTQYKNKKPRTVNFYHIEGKDETLKKLDDKISTTYKDNSRDEIKDMEYANDVGAQKMTVCLQADSLKLKDIIAKAKLLFKNSENLGITKLKVEGIDDDGVFEPVDLVQHKLVFHGYVEYDNIVTIENMFGFLEKAYHKYYDYCVRNFI